MCLHKFRLLLHQAWIWLVDSQSKFHSHLEVLYQGVHFLLQVHTRMLYTSLSFQLWERDVKLLRLKVKDRLKCFPSFQQVSLDWFEIQWFFNQTIFSHSCTLLHNHMNQQLFQVLPMQLTFCFKVGSFLVLLETLQMKVHFIKEQTHYCKWCQH